MRSYRMTTPYVGFSNETLRLFPDVKSGDQIECPQCKERHRLEPADDGSTLVMFYYCGATLCIGALNGKLIVGQESDVHGEITTPKRKREKPNDE